MFFFRVFFSPNQIGVTIERRTMPTQEELLKMNALLQRTSEEEQAALVQQYNESNAQLAIRSDQLQTVEMAKAAVEMAKAAGFRAKDREIAQMRAEIARLRSMPRAIQGQGEARYLTTNPAFVYGLHNLTFLPLTPHSGS